MLSLIRICLGFPFILSLIIGCSVQDDCFVADSVHLVATVTDDVGSYSIVLRTSGLQEKENFYELYEGAPDFDDCGRTTVPLLDVVHVDVSEGGISYLRIQGHKIHVIYGSDGSAVVDLVKVEVEVD